MTGAPSGGSEAPGVVEGDCASRAQHHRVATTALHALRRLSTIASALGHQEEQIPDNVSTRSDVDACSRASQAYSGNIAPVFTDEDLLIKNIIL